MRNFSLRALGRAGRCALVASVLAGGCGDDGTGEARGPLHVAGVIQNLELNTERQEFTGVAGARVCLYPDNAPCTTSDASGAYLLRGLPENTDVILSYEHADYVPVLRLIRLFETNRKILAPSIMGTQALAEQLLVDFEFESLPGRGSLQFFAMQPSNGVLQLQEVEGFTVDVRDLEGNTIRLLGDLGEEEGDPGPRVFASAEGAPDPRLTSSTRRGVGGIANLEPGDYDLVFSHPTLECSERLSEAGWRTETPNAARFTIIDGWVTSMVGMICQRPL